MVKKNKLIIWCGTSGHPVYLYASSEPVKHC